MSKEEIVHLFKIVRDCDDEDWQHNEKRFIEIIGEYSKQQSIAFGQWVTHNDWVYLPSKGYWLNEEQEENLQPLTDEQLYNLFIQTQNNQ